MRLHKTGDTRKLINVNVPRLRLFISVKPNRAFDNRLEPEYSRNNEHAIESGGEKKGRGFKEERQSFNSLPKEGQLSFFTSRGSNECMMGRYIVSIFTFIHGTTGSVGTELGAGVSLLRKYLLSPVSSGAGVAQSV